MLVPTIPNIPSRKSPADLEVYQSAGRAFGKVLHELYLYTSNICSSSNAAEIAKRFRKLVHQHIKEHWGYSYPFSSQCNHLEERFGAAICVSVNEIVAHGRPVSDTRIRSTPDIQDAVSVDCGLQIWPRPDGCPSLCLDAAFTVVPGHPSPPWIQEPLVALNHIIESQPQGTMEIADIIQHTAAQTGLKQVVSLTGHGIGRQLHEAPVIHNAVADFKNVKLFDGLCFCAEPIFVKPGDSDHGSFIASTCIEADGWAVSTISGEPASHFETTFGVIDGQIIDLIGVTKWLL